MTKEQIDLTKLVLDLLQTIFIIIAAVWSYLRFFREGTHRPRIELDVSHEILERDQTQQALAFIVSATNHGQVDFRFNDLRLRVLGKIQGEDVKTIDFKTMTGNTPYLEFPEGTTESRSIIPKKSKYFFVRPGVTQHFSYSTAVPSSWSRVIVRACFKYPTTGELHTAERIFCLNKDK